MNRAAISEAQMIFDGNALLLVAVVIAALAVFIGAKR